MDCPIIEMHDGVAVVREDVIDGGGLVSRSQLVSIGRSSILGEMRISLDIG